MNEIKDEKSLRNEILQLIPSGVGVYDVSDTEVRKEYLNDGYYQMIDAARHRRHQYDGNKTVNAIHEDDLPGLYDEVRAAIREKRMLQYKFRVLSGEGNYIWIAISANHIPVDDKTERFYAAYYDIDELIRTEEKLRNNELLLNESIKYSGILHFTYYPDRHRYEMAIVPENLKGVPKSLDDFPDSFIERFRPNDSDAALFREMVQKIDDGSQEAECTIQLHVNAKYSWYRIHLWNFLDADGKALRAIGSAIDISKFKEEEEAFDEEKLRMNSLGNDVLAASSFSVTGDSNIEINNDGIFDYRDTAKKEIYEEALRVEPEIANQQSDTLRILLSAAEQIPDKDQREMFIRTCSHAGMLRMYDSGKRELKLEYRRWTNRGLIWVSTRIVLIQDPNSGEVRAFYYTTDVNDRVVFNKITSVIIDKNYETVSYYDLNSGKLYLKYDASAAEISFNEISYQDAVEDAIGRYVQPGDAISTKEKFEIDNIIKHLEKEGVYSIYYNGKGTDDSLPFNPQKRMKCDLFYLDENRDIIVFLQTNITEIYEQERMNRVRMEEALEAAESANVAKTEFLSRISHDIRTPISIISSMTNFANDDIDDKEKLENDLSKIRSANSFLLSLINDVLDISKIDSGKIELNPEPYTFEEHSTNIRNVLETMCAEKGLECAMIRKRKTGVIVIDNVRINQIILNLLSNAVKYTPPGGKITYISDSEDLPDNKIRFGFEIQDNGIGMSRGFQEKMFEPFTQEYDNPWRPAGISGTGLGLSIVKRMVEIMDGTFEVESELGKGTTVRCSIICPDALRDPRYRDFANKDLKGSSVFEPLSGKVLIVEDNPMNMEIAIRIIGGFGLDIDSAENGVRAVEMFEKSKPNEYQAILMDIQMPIMNGYEATEKIRQLSRPDAKSIPIIAMTADAFSDAANRGRDAGMNEYLVKPLEPDKIRTVLGALINKY